MSEQCDRETTNVVARMLEEELDGDECTGLCMVARNVDHGGPETYEDWVYPLRRVPDLALECTEDDLRWWYWIALGDELMRFEEWADVPGSGPGVATAFTMDINDPDVDIRPVLREDMPVFQPEVDDG